GFVAQNIHVEADALLDHRLTNPASADNADGLAGHFVAQKRQIRMPIAPLVVSHQMFGRPQLAGESSQREEGELRSRFCEDVGGVGEGNLVAVRVGAVDVVKPDRVLGNNPQRALPRFENLGINRIAKRGDESVDAAADSFDNQVLRWRLGIGINLEVGAALAQAFDGRVADVGGGKDSEFLVWHGVSHDASVEIFRACTSWVEYAFRRTGNMVATSPALEAAEKRLKQVNSAFCATTIQQLTSDFWVKKRPKLLLWFIFQQPLKPCPFKAHRLPAQGWLDPGLRQF